MPGKTSIPETFSSFSALWQPHIIAEVNDQHIKIAKIDGAFLWHAHSNSDELFILLDGKLTLEIEGSPSVVMNIGDVYTIPRNVRHRPVAENAQILMIEKVGTVNTGDEDSTRTVVPVDAIGGVKGK